MNTVMKKRNFVSEVLFHHPATFCDYIINTFYFLLLAGIFLASVAGVAAIAGFGKTLAASKRQEQVLVEKGVIENVRLLDAGSSLAMRALGWGTAFAVLGTFTFSYGVWKLSGATNVWHSLQRICTIYSRWILLFQMKEFRLKMGSLLPKLSKDGPPTSRTEFEGLRDLMEYVSTWKTEK